MCTCVYLITGFTKEQGDWVLRKCFRCGGQVLLNAEGASCFQCGWEDYSLTVIPRKSNSVLSGRARMLRHWEGKFDPVRVSYTATEKGKVIMEPTCPFCFSAMEKHTYDSKRNDYYCENAHRISLVDANGKFGDMERWK